ncbi:alpha/beta hydrolase [Ahniella affigens]|uniref:Alpha/beta hydrolase n=1 Tax=Ahniella affigens TaxID=2021234 RepID=A0A2P1PLR2_9GAMM|nr:alpha/beta hydrolase [Ahniella affigens]AVP95787.1 alpha/beta hydrolase [Ahniella affigens]
MRGTVVLSHGLESGPEATKVSALALVAERLGFAAIRPDYRDLDQAHGLCGATLRLARLRSVLDGLPAGRPCVLVGSSFGAFISGLASLECSVSGLFLIALPLKLPSYDRDFDLADVPTAVVHGWNDELIPAMAVAQFCHARQLDLQLLPDDHRLNQQVDMLAARFAHFLEQR